MATTTRTKSKSPKSSARGRADTVKRVKRPAMAQILREDKDWGVRLILKPFTDPRQNTSMEMSAEISKAKPGRNPEIKFWFSGVPIHNPLKVTDSLIWQNAFKQLNDEARKVSEEMKKAAATPKSPKGANKPRDRKKR